MKNELDYEPFDKTREEILKASMQTKIPMLKICLLNLLRFQSFFELTDEEIRCVSFGIKPE
ncbi:TPA: hypothetical protein ACUI23_000430 [Staphylococcus pseudintermedius]